MGERYIEESSSKTRRNILAGVGAIGVLGAGTFLTLSDDGPQAATNTENNNFNEKEDQ